MRFWDTLLTIKVYCIHVCMGEGSPNFIIPLAEPCSDFI